MVGVGDLLYLGRNGLVEIVQVKKSNGDYIGSFASPGGARDEGLECDPVNFAPKLALWSREFNSPGFISAIEIEGGTCTCGGEPLEIEVALDIKPTSCPNPVNFKSKGVLIEDLTPIKHKHVTLLKDWQTLNTFFNPDEDTRSAFKDCNHGSRRYGSTDIFTPITFL